jgi:hypothetical protein
VRKRKGQVLTGILAVDVHLSSTFPIIGRAYILYNRTSGIRNLPHFLLHNLRKRSKETIHTHTLFHLYHSLSLILDSTNIIDQMQEKTFRKIKIISCQIYKKFLVYLSHYGLSTYVKFCRNTFL